MSPPLCSPTARPACCVPLCESDHDYVLPDGTLAECDRVGDSRADFSHKHRRHGLNGQVLTDPFGRLLWISPTLPGRTHDLTAARPPDHPDLRAPGRSDSRRPRLHGSRPLGDDTPRRPPGRDITPTQQTVNHTLSTARTPVERGIARLKSWRIFRKSRCNPNRMPSIAAAVRARQQICGYPEAEVPFGRSLREESERAHLVAPASTPSATRNPTPATAPSCPKIWATAASRSNAMPRRAGGRGRWSCVIRSTR
ncbi:transposase family protein [Streptomyces sp. ID05-39B]|uniref:transposase family protein n=1 Tax=Streptomyces sp. ID05-39B TaxID=3028664 RepID=UPI0034DB6DB8